MKLNELVKFIQEKNLRNSVFVDVTANEEVSKSYASLLQKSVSVVACNKIAASSAYNNYEQLKNTAREFNTSFCLKPMWGQVCRL